MSADIQKAGMRTTMAVGLLAFIPVGPLSSQTLSLPTADPEPVPHRILAIEAGAEAGRDVAFPLSGLEGDLLRAPMLGFRYGVGGIVEIQLAGGYQVLLLDARREAPFDGRVEVDGDVTRDWVDPVVATKIRLLEERGARPAVGLRFATRLPAAGNESGLGNDTIDFLYWILAGKTWGRTRLLANVGLGVLSLPTTGDVQNDVVLYGAAVERSVGRRWTLFAEANGRTDRRGDAPPGTEDTGQARLGGRWARGTIAIAAAVAVGLHEADPDLGVTLGVTSLWQLVP
jgi:hypothetical protein